MAGTAGQILRIGTDSAAAWGDLPQSVVDATMPWRIEIDPWTARSATVGSWTPTVNTALLGNGELLNSAQNDSVAWDIALAAGTWTISILATKSNSAGIMTWDIDGTTVGTWDGYPGGTNNVVTNLTGISVAATGKKRLKLTMATKNVSSSGYLAVLQWVALQRTA